MHVSDECLSSTLSTVLMHAPTVSHVSTSVGEAETYAVGNAAKSIMSFQCNSEEMGLPFPKRIIVQVDSETARSFSNNSCKKSKLKHIDCRQEWVQVLRDKDLLKCVHIPGTENLADLFTKILDPGDFIRQRGTIMIECPHVTQPYANMAREDPNDTPENDPSSSMPLVNAALKSDYVAKVLCGEEDHSDSCYSSCDSISKYCSKNCSSFTGCSISKASTYSIQEAGSNYARCVKPYLPLRSCLCASFEEV